MEPSFIAALVANLLLVLAAGFISGAVCKRTGVSMLVGYLAIGAVIGPEGLGLLSHESRELEYLARLGALLLLFSIGIEFSPTELARQGRAFFVGGSLQMTLVALPAIGVALLMGAELRAAVLVGGAVALSSTVLVFKALEEWGQASSPHGRRAIGILLFQDVALVPLMLLVPLLAGAPEGPGLAAWGLLAMKSLVFLAGVLTVRLAVERWGVDFLHGLASVELIVLFALIALGAACLPAYAMNLPPALGALAAGIVLSGNRLSAQFDALMLPFRETFAVVFFVSLGTLMRFGVLVDAPLATLGGLLGVLALKSAAATLALRAAGLRWQAALGMGVGLAQLGEFSFVLLTAGMGTDPPVIERSTYDLLLFVALGTLILTPQLLKMGLGLAGRALRDEPSSAASRRIARAVPQAIVAGVGPIGGRVASHLETVGVDVCLVDLNPVNLQPFAQQGFRAVAGDGREPEILRHAGVEQCRLAVVTVPNDDDASSVVDAIRRLNSGCLILVRCRYQASLAAFAHANAVVSEEVEATRALLQFLEEVKGPGPEEGDRDGG